MKEIKSEKSLNKLTNEIITIFNKAKKETYSQINNILVKTYWKIGKNIVEFEQKWNISAEYWDKLIINLSKKLSKIWKGFSRSNLIYMRLFYIKYKKSETLSHQLSWSHYKTLIYFIYD